MESLALINLFSKTNEKEKKMFSKANVLKAIT